MYEISLILFYPFFGGGGIDDHFANFARDISLNAEVMSNSTICGVSTPPPPPYLPVYPSLPSVHRTRFFFKFWLGALGRRRRSLM